MFQNVYRIVPELDPLRYGLKEDRTYYFSGLLTSSKSSGNLSEAIEFLNRTYCGNMGAEFSYLHVCKHINFSR